jgi:hypothetical protein
MIKRLHEKSPLLSKFIPARLTKLQRDHESGGGLLRNTRDSDER